MALLPARLRALAPTAAAAALALTLAACGSSGSSTPKAGSATSAAGAAAPTSAAAQKGAVKVGAFDFPEGRLLANVYADGLKKAGYDASVVQLQQRETAQPALQKGDIDVIPEYVSSLLDFLQANSSTPDAAANVTKLQGLATAKGVTVLTPSAATDNYAYSVAKDFADKNNIKTLSDLAAYSKKSPITLAGTPECVDRSYCKKGLEKLYGFSFGGYKTTVLSSQASVDLLLRGQAQMLESNSSDGVLSANPVVVLTDDKGLNHQDNIVPAVTTAKLTPELKTALDAISAKLSQDALNKGNKDTQIDRKPVDEAATALVDSLGL